MTAKSLVISPPQPISNAFATLPLLNATALDVSIDPRFGIKAAYGEDTLPLTPCFMNVVELLAQYAELDWLGRVRRRRGVVLPEYPQVEIAVIPASPATTVEVRLVIWGMWMGIRDIIGKNNFHEAEFEVLWERQVVAYIYYTRPLDLQGISNRTLGANEPLTLLPSPNKTIGGDSNASKTRENSFDALDEGEFSWKPFLLPTGKTLTVVEVFLTVMAGLKSAAPHAASEKVSGTYASAALDVFANVQFNLYKRRNPRTKPPYFQYIHVIKSLRLVPGFMLQKKRFSELYFSIEVSGMQVGEGYLEKGHYIPPRFVLGDALEPKDNVSIS